MDPLRAPSRHRQADCRLMVDKITTLPKTKIGKRIGQLSDADTVRLNRAILVFLGLAGAFE